MTKLLTAAVAAALALGSTMVAAKMVDLTQHERMEMRDRADRLVAERATATTASHKQAVAMPRAVSGKQELTQEEKMQLRNRAAHLVADSATTRDGTHKIK